MVFPYLMSEKLRMLGGPQNVLTNEPQSIIARGLYQLRNVQQDGVWREGLENTERILCCQGVGWVLL